MVSARRAMRPIVAIYPRVANPRYIEGSCRAHIAGVDACPDAGLDAGVSRGSVTRWHECVPFLPVTSPTPSGKRRPPAKKAPAGGRGTTTKKAPRGFKGRMLWLLKWGLVAALGLFVVLTVVLIVAYQKTTIPNPNKALQTQTT